MFSSDRCERAKIRLVSPLPFADQAEKQVLRLDRDAPELARFVAGEEQHPPRSFGIPLEHPAAFSCWSHEKPAVLRDTSRGGEAPALWDAHLIAFGPLPVLYGIPAGPPTWAPELSPCRTETSENWIARAYRAYAGDQRPRMRALEDASCLTPIGFIGLGVMGRPMARNLLTADGRSSCTAAAPARSTRSSPRAPVPPRLQRTSRGRPRTSSRCCPTAPTSRRCSRASEGVFAAMSAGHHRGRHEHDRARDGTRGSPRARPQRGGVHARRARQRRRDRRHRRHALDHGRRRRARRSPTCGPCSTRWATRDVSSISANRARARSARPAISS